MLVRTIAIALALAVSPALTGCPAPSSTTVTNAIASAEQAAQTAAAVVADAQVVWPIVYAAIPAASQAAAQAAYNEALFTANHAVLVLNDAIASAIAANTPNPNFTAVLGPLSDAVAQIVAVVEQFAAPTVASHVRTPKGVDAVADMKAAVEHLKTLK